MEPSILSLAASGQTEALKGQVEAGVDINQTDLDGRTALMLAAGGGHVECIKFLLDAGADVNMLDNYLRSVLNFAASNGRADCVKVLLNSGSEKIVNVTDWKSRSPIILVARSKGDNVQSLQKLLSAGADIEIKDVKGDTALANAAKHGNVSCIQALLSAGCHKHVNVTNRVGQTPIILAAGCTGDNTKCLQLLLNSGADVNIKDISNHTALAKAAKFGNTGCVCLLLKVSCEHINMRDEFNRTPLMFAAGSKGDNADCLLKLIDAGADIEMKDKCELSALAFAARYGNINCVDILLDAGSHELVNSPGEYGVTTFMQAVRSAGDNVKFVDKFLQVGADVDIRDDQGNTVLLHAAQSGNVKCVEALLEADCHTQVNIPNKYGLTPLMHVACSKGDNVQVLKKLLNAEAVVDVQDSYGYRALGYAAMSGNSACVQALLDACCHNHVDIQHSRGETALMLAAGAKGDHVQCLKKLIDAGADINLIDELNFKTLAHAVEAGNTDCVQLLLDLGSHKHVNVRDFFGRTPLVSSVRHKGDDIECVQKLLDAGANVDVKDGDNFTAISFAAQYGNVKCLQTLLDSGGRELVNIPNIVKRTPLMLASGFIEGNVHCVQMLLDAGADVGMKDRQGDTALAYAAERGSVSCLCALLKAGGHKFVNDSNVNGMTPLMIAAAYGDYVHCVRKLLDAGSDVQIKDKFGATALDHAIDNDNLLCVQVLKDAMAALNITVDN